MKEKKIIVEGFCDKCGYTTEHDRRTSEDRDVVTTITCCMVCGEIDVDCDSISLYEN